MKQMMQDILSSLLLATPFLVLSFFIFGLEISLALALLLLPCIIFLAPLYLKRLIHKDFELTEVLGQTSDGSHYFVEKYARLAGLKTPKIFRSSKPIHQAFYFKCTTSQYGLVLFDPLLNDLSSDEVESVIALLIAQIKTHSTPKRFFGVIFLKSFFTITEFLDVIFRFLTGVKFNPKKLRSRLITYLFSPVACFLFYFIERKKSVLSSDSTASLWLKDKYRIAKVLKKLQCYSRYSPYIPPIYLCHLFLISPVAKYRWSKYLNWHPEIKTRTKHLIGHYPI